jgi:hypothetical protein
MRVLEVQWSQAPSLMCEVTLKDLIFQYSSVKLITLCEQKARFGFSTMRVLEVHGHGPQSHV